MYSLIIEIQLYKLIMTSLTVLVPSQCDVIQRYHNNLVLFLFFQVTVSFMPYFQQSAYQANLDGIRIADSVVGLQVQMKQYTKYT